jgi:hypothetical protein
MKTADLTKPLTFVVRHELYICHVLREEEICDMFDG